MRRKGYYLAPREEPRLPPTTAIGTIGPFLPMFTMLVATHEPSIQADVLNQTFPMHRCRVISNR